VHADDTVERLEARVKQAEQKLLIETLGALVKQNAKKHHPNRSPESAPNPDVRLCQPAPGPELDTQ